MTTPPPRGRPVDELTDTELEQQGKNAHETRNWVFLHGTADQFANHTTRMLALEQEYLRRYPKRTWQGSGGATAGSSEVEEGSPTEATSDPVAALLQLIADSPNGRMHKLEVHQAARDAGLDRASLARLYTAKPPLLTTDQQDRVLTDAGRDRLLSAPS